LYKNINILTEVFYSVLIFLNNLFDPDACIHDGNLSVEPTAPGCVYAARSGVFLSSHVSTRFPCHLRTTAGMRFRSKTQCPQPPRKHAQPPPIVAGCTGFT